MSETVCEKTIIQMIDTCLCETLDSMEHCQEHPEQIEALCHKFTRLTNAKISLTQDTKHMKQPGQCGI